MKKYSNISWLQLFILIGTFVLFFFELTQSISLKKIQLQKELKVYEVEGYLFAGGAVTGFSGNGRILEIPAGYSYGETITKIGSVTFKNRNQAFDFLQKNYAVGAERYYEFYNEIYTRQYPWYYEYSINQYTYVPGNDIVVNTVARRAFKENTQIDKVVLPSTIENIELFAFQNCSNLEEVEFNKGLRTIGDSSFWGTAIETLNNLPESLEKIDPYAFFRCKNLKEVTIPKNVKYMTLGTFNGCTCLKKVTILSKYEIQAWDTDVYHTFSNCTALETVKIPRENLNYYSSTLPWSRYVDKYVTY